MNPEDFKTEFESNLAQSELFAPLEVRIVKRNESDSYGDGVIEVTWREKKVAFVFTSKSRSAPSVLKPEIERLKEATYWSERSPLLVVPFISESLRELLMASDVSALDLNGNYLLQSPMFVAIRTDRPNKFPEDRAISKIYSGTSSLVGRYLMRGPNHERTVGEIHSDILSLNGEISLSTVSKVLSGLAEDLMIDKTDGVTLLQPEKLLRKLRSAYQPARIERTLKLNLPVDDDQRAQTAFLTDVLPEWVWNAPASVHRYLAVPQMPDRGTLRSFVIPHGAPIRNLLEFEDNRWFSCFAVVTRDSFPFFARDKCWASDIETCLALTSSDKRENEMSDQIAAQILERFE